MNGNWVKLGARARGESGISLIELLIGITISTLISVSLVGAIYLGFRTTNDTQTRIWESQKANLMSSFFVPDVQNASTIQKNAMETAAACGTPRAAVVNLLLTAADGSSVSYYRGSLAGENTNYLYRKICSGGSASVRPMVYDLSAAPTFNCRPTTDCVTQSWTSITAVISQADANGKNQYATTIQAAKRVT